ncbi:MAG: non-ribosomal peptide synthetase [Gammaproteobacteria bacterium]
MPQVAVSRLVLNTDYVQLAPGHRMGHASNVSFDAATFEFWGAFLNGGTLVGVDKDTALNPDAFAQLIKQRKIDVLFVTTALFNVLSKQTPDVFANLQYLLFGGEACDPNQVRAVLNQAGGPQHLLHVYGPTENTTFSTWYEVNEVLPGSTTVPIGYPIANSTLYVLDEQLRPVPVGVPGEIYVGGIGVADGYLNRPELTREVFLIDPFHAGKRMYKTGDLGRLLENGALEILGRMDDQVKIRGFRIELGEVETAVNQLPGIRETSVVVRSDANGNKQLVAYCEKVPGATLLAVAELKAKLKQFLPDYMVPSAIVLLDHLPITPNGKVDKRALPAPSAEDYASNAYVAPRNPTETALADIWCDVLGIEQVGAYDDFFELGGHSLLITKVSTRIKQQLGVELPLRTLFEVPTVAALAEIISAVNFTASTDAEAETGEEEFEEGSL